MISSLEDGGIIFRGTKGVHEADGRAGMWVYSEFSPATSAQQICRPGDRDEELLTTEPGRMCRTALNLHSQPGTPQCQRTRRRRGRLRHIASGKPIDGAKEKHVILPVAASISSPG